MVVKGPDWTPVKVPKTYVLFCYWVMMLLTFHIKAKDKKYKGGESDALEDQDLDIVPSRPAVR